MKYTMFVPRHFIFAFLISFFLSISLVLSKGEYSRSAIVLVFIAFMLCFWLLFSALRDKNKPVDSYLASLTVWFGFFILWNFHFLFVQSQSHFVPVDIKKIDWVSIGMIILLFSYLPAMLKKTLEPKTIGIIRFAAFACLIFAGGYKSIQAVPQPPIDVWAVQTTGVQAIFHGHNPYRSVAVCDTGPRDACDVPYVYPPGQLYATFPAYFFLGEIRWTMLAAIIAAGILLRILMMNTKQILPNIIQDAPALIIWLSPILFFIIEQAWIDPVAIFFVAFLAFFTLKGRSVIMAIFLGLALSAKQTMFWFLPTTPFFLHFTRRQWLISLGTLAFVLAPFLLWDTRALWFANFTFIAWLPPRANALTFNNWFYQAFGVLVPGNIAFVLAAIIVTVSVWRMPKRITGLMVTLIATYMIFFTMNRWAFANYYFFIIGLSAITAAVSLRDYEDNKNLLYINKSM